MKRFAITLAAATAILSTTMFSSCGKSDAERAAADSIAADSLVHQIDIDMQVLSAVRSYAITIDTNLYHLAISADVQWPTHIGDYKIKNLQDSIIAYCFPNIQAKEVRPAIVGYVSDVVSTGLDYDGADIKPIDRVFQDSIGNFSVNLDARVLEFGKRLVAYQIVEQNFLGGAHPNSNSRIFTYDLESNRVITGADLIASDKTNDFTVAVMKQLSAQLDMTPTELRENLLTSSFSVSDDVYVNNGFIYVHYNPYEVLPYSFGALDVQVSPYDVASMLTPYARRLLLE